MRYFLPLLFTLLLSPAAFAQHVNIYSNPNWILDSLVGFHDPLPLGLNYRPPHQPYKVPYNFLPDVSADSNSYSRIRYSAASNQNQFFTAAIARPISQKSDFNLGLVRVSNIGWMNTSHARITSATAVVHHRFSPKLSLEVNGDLLIADKEQNGGLRRDSYVIRQEDGLFSNITSDVFLSSAYNRHVNSNSRANLAYKINPKFAAFAVASYSQEKFSYLDVSPNLAYYKLFQDDTTITSISDSSSLTAIDAAMGLNYEDSLLGKKMSVGASSEIQSATYRSNGRLFYASNLAISSSLQLMGTADHLRIGLDVIPIGYNSGDYRLNGSYGLKWFDAPSSDSTRSRSFLTTISARIHRFEPSLISQQYQSTIISYSNDFGKVSAADFTLSNDLQYGVFMLQADLFYQSRLNLVYLNDSFQATQYNGELAIGGVRLSAGIDAKRNYFSTDFVFQQNIFESLYSVPDVSLEGIYGYSFPMFKKSIYVQAGLRGIYFTAYQARGYVPFLDMMYVQQTNRFGNYGQIDPFAKVTIQSVDVTLRFMNITYGVFTNNPIVAPGYPSVPRFFEFTVDWRFKN